MGNTRNNKATLRNLHAECTTVNLDGYTQVSLGVGLLPYDGLSVRLQAKCSVAPQRVHTI
jgi:hypothetical protein